MNELHLAGHAVVNAFSEIQVVWERRRVTERCHNLGNGDLAFRLVPFKTCLTGWSTKWKYFCVKYAVRWKKNTKLEVQVTFLLVHQDVRCNKRILAFNSKSSFKRNQDWNFSGEKGFYWMCLFFKHSEIWFNLYKTFCTTIENGNLLGNQAEANFEFSSNDRSGKNWIILICVFTALNRCPSCGWHYVSKILH